MTTTPQSELWNGIFGDAYQERNALTGDEVSKRRNFLRDVIRTIYMYGGTTPKSVLEIGAGQGPNMCALEDLVVQEMIPMKLYATEPNQKARIKLSENTKTVEILDEIPKEPLAELVFTYGVMIHIHPAHIKSFIDKMYNSSSRYIMCCEYFAPKTRPIVYRGEKDALWLDDYGTLLKHHHKLTLKLIDYGFKWRPATGLDNITYWIFEKVEKVI